MNKNCGVSRSIFNGDVSYRNCRDFSNKDNSRDRDENYRNSSNANGYGDSGENLRNGGSNRRNFGNGQRCGFCGRNPPPPSPPSRLR